MSRHSVYTTYRQYEENELFWLEVTTAEIFTESYSFSTAEERSQQTNECCNTHEADIVPPAGFPDNRDPRRGCPGRWVVGSGR